MTDSAHSQKAEIARLMQKCVLFRDFELEDLMTLATYARRQKYSAGDAIFHGGDPGESLMGVLVGSVRILRPAERGEIIIADFAAGDVFGEIALLDGGGRSADAVAITNCELVVLERREFIPFLRERSGLSIELLKLLCGKLRLADDRSIDFLFLDLSTRLAKALVRLCPSKEGRPGKTSLTQGELAKIVGGTRPNINRQLREWERRGLIEQRKGWIIVPDCEKLSAVAGAD